MHAQCTAPLCTFLSVCRPAHPGREKVPSCPSAFITRAAAVAVARSTSPFLRRIALCLALTALDLTVVAKFAGVLCRTTMQQAVEQTGVTLHFTALFGSLVRT